MNVKFFNFFNFIGVILLAVFCAFQWMREVRLNREIRELHEENFSQKGAISEKEKFINGQNEDLAFFKNQFSETQNSLNDTGAILKKIKLENAQLSEEIAQIKVVLEAWKNAVSERDSVIEIANKNIREILAKLEIAIAAQNEITKKYNALVAEINAKNSENK